MAFTKKIFLAFICFASCSVASPAHAETATQKQSIDLSKPKQGLFASEESALQALGFEADWEKRWQAAGWFSYGASPAARDALIATLDNPEDWRLVLTAAESLGRLQEKRALTKLQALKDSYWLPHVRTVAAKAIAAINHKEVYGEPWNPAAIIFGGFRAPYPNNQQPTEVKYGTPTPRIPLIPRPGELSADELKQHDYKTSVGLHKEITVTPKCGLQLGKTFLLGHSRGEWGGELVLQDEPGNVRFLIKHNTTGIHKMPFGTVALVGLSHMMQHDCSIYLVEKSIEGGWEAKRWRALPGAPMRSGFLKDGRLVIECTSGFILTLSDDGQLGMLEANSIK